MIDSSERLQARLRALRSDFDLSFAQPRRPAEAAGTDLLAIRVAGQPYAVRLFEVAALERDRPITPVPSDNAALLGVAGLRGSLVAVFDLARLLGHGTSATTRWLMLVQGSLVAVAFGEFERQLRLGPEAVAGAQQAGKVSGEVVRSDGISRPILQLGALARSCAPPLTASSREESR